MYTRTVFFAGLVESHRSKIDQSCLYFSTRMVSQKKPLKVNQVHIVLGGWAGHRMVMVWWKENVLECEDAVTNLRRMLYTREYVVACTSPLLCDCIIDSALRSHRAACTCHNHRFRLTKLYSDDGNRRLQGKESKDQRRHAYTYLRIPHNLPVVSTSIRVSNLNWAKVSIWDA